MLPPPLGCRCRNRYEERLAEVVRRLDELLAPLLTAPVDDDGDGRHVLGEGLQEELAVAVDVDGDGKLSKRELRHLVAVLTQKASDDVAAAKAKHEDEVQRLEDAYKSIVKAAEDKAWASENELDKAQEAAEMTVEEAKEAANEELKAGLAAAEEALAAAEEVAAIEIKGWRDAADAFFSSSLNMSFLDSDQDGLDRDDPLPVHVESLLKDKTVAAKIDKIVAKEKKYEYEIADSNGAPELRHAPSLTHSRSFSSRIGRALIPLL